MNSFWQLVRYAIVGISTNALIYIAYLLATSSGIGHKTAMTLLYALAILLTFTINRHWTFKHRGHAPTAFMRYVTIYGLGYVINLTALYLFVDRLGHPHQIVQGILILIIAITLFTLQKFWGFKHRKN